MKHIVKILILSAWVVRAQAGEMPPYDRKAWGGWPDEDGDCQDLRAELLIAQSRVPVTFRGGGACVVATGEWIGAYSGDLFTDARDVEIDHVVPLKVAHRSGGWAWTRKKKRAFARDPANLRIVSRSLNRAKGAKDPTQWLDVRPRFRAAYLATWARVRGKWF